MSLQQKRVTLTPRLYNALEHAERLPQPFGARLLADAMDLQIPTINKLMRELEEQSVVEIGGTSRSKWFKVLVPLNDVELEGAEHQAAPDTASASAQEAAALEGVNYETSTQLTTAERALIRCLQELEKCHPETTDKDILMALLSVMCGILGSLPEPYRNGGYNAAIQTLVRASTAGNG